jgi:hypothetical protein
LYLVPEFFKRTKSECFGRLRCRPNLGRLQPIGDEDLVSGGVAELQETGRGRERVESNAGAGKREIPHTQFLNRFSTIVVQGL